jgi:hypothetical protein
MKKQYDDDDGRVIASMDVEELRPRRIPWRIKADKLRPKTDETKKEAWHIAFNATLAALFIGTIIMLGISLVVLIMTLVW